MPLTPKGKKIKRNMQKEYGKDQGNRVFYASQNKGNISGTHKPKRAASKPGRRKRKASK
ncbi:MAG: hypothetical protein ACR2RF_32215 [Geminicoccaceae bacterium]